MSIFAMRVERTDDRPHIWPGSESRSNYSQTAPVTAKPLVFFIQSEHGGEQRRPVTEIAATASRWVDSARSRRAVYPTPCARPGGRTG